MGLFRGFWTWRTARNTGVLARDVKQRRYADAKATRQAGKDVTKEFAAASARADYRAQLWRSRADDLLAAGQPAAWLQDPMDDLRLRYWDGRQWTNHTAPGC